MHKSMRNAAATAIMALLLLLLAGCDAKTGGEEINPLVSLLTLSFLPSGMQVLAGEPLLYNTDWSSAAVPLLGLVFNYLAILAINLVDFAIWLVSWIPGYNMLIEYISKAHDIDQGTGLLAMIFSSHRNFLSHSLLNPIILLYLAIAYAVGKSSAPSLVRLFFALPLMGFAAGLLADTMPASWSGFSRINISLFGADFATLSALFSWLWLLLWGGFALLFAMSLTGEDSD